MQGDKHNLVIFYDPKHHLAPRWLVVTVRDMLGYSNLHDAVAHYPEGMREQYRIRYKGVRKVMTFLTTAGLLRLLENSEKYQALHFHANLKNYLEEHYPKYKEEQQPKGKPAPVVVEGGYIIPPECTPEQAEAAQQWAKSLFDKSAPEAEPEEEPVIPLNHRTVIRKLVEYHSERTGLHVKEVWAKLYEEFTKRTGFALFWDAPNKLEFLELSKRLPQLWEVARDNLDTLQPKKQ